ncbi:MAG: phage major capsid protein [Mycobacteriaceae bacterium]
MADTATFSAAMKTKFIGPIRDSLHSGKVLLFGSGGDSPAGTDANPTNFKGILPSAENIDFVGNEFRIPYKTARNQAVGFRSENETLPAAGNSKYTYLTEPMRYAYGAFNITGQLMKASETNEGAFKAAFKQEMEDTVLTSKIDHNRAAWNDGSGKFTDVRTNALTTDTVIQVNSTINFRGGEYIDFVTAAGAVVAPACLVTAVDRVNRTITLSAQVGAALTAGTHFPVRASSDSTIAVPNNSQNREIQGVQSIVSDSGTLHGVNPSTVPQWKSYKKTAIGAISDAAIRDALDGVGFESGVDLDGDGNDYALISSRGIRRRYADTLLSVKRFTNADSTKLHGGFTVLDFDGNPWFIDDSCPVGTTVGLSLKDLFWAQMSDWEWMEEDGKVLKWEPRKDRYTAVLFKYCQLGTTARNRHFILTGITDDVR